MSSSIHNRNFSRSSSSRDSTSRRGSDSDASYPSTAPTSVAGSPRIGESKTMQMPPVSPPRYVRYADDTARYQHAQEETYVYEQAYEPVYDQPIYEQPVYEPIYEKQRLYETYQAHEDLSPSTSCCPRASTDTYMSLTDSDDDDDEASENDLDDLSDGTLDGHVHGYPASLSAKSDSFDEIPPLPEYRADIVDSSIQPATPHEFAQLFPSLNRISIRHDEFTTDGNMNLRVDMTVPKGSRRRPTSYQLFHLRMYDLAKREFSLRRYGRDSGREVCNSKFAEPTDKKSKSMEFKQPKKAREPKATTTSNDDTSRPTLQRSMSSALRSLGMGGGSGKPVFRRTHTAGSSDSSRRPSTSQSAASAYEPDAPAYYGDEVHPVVRINSVRSTSTTNSAQVSPVLSAAASQKKQRQQQQPRINKNKVKLEFSNYARVDVERRGGSSQHDSHSHNSSSTRYEFEWWGHKYYWKRVLEKHLDVVNFHLMRRDERGVETPVAHIVPETRSPNQVLADEEAGGWVPPCHFWISDPSVLAAMTDVADVIMATGLIALVDDCIRTRWQQPPRKTHRLGMGMGIPRLADVEGPRALMHHVFHRRASSSSSNSGGNKYTSSPLRQTQPVAAY